MTRRGTLALTERPTVLRGRGLRKLPPGRRRGGHCPAGAHRLGHCTARALESSAQPQRALSELCDAVNP